MTIWKTAGWEKKTKQNRVSLTNRENEYRKKYQSKKPNSLLTKKWVNINSYLTLHPQLET